MRLNAGLRAAVAIGLAWVIWAGALPASARLLEIRYRATDVLPGDDPTFGLRLNDMFNGVDVDFSFTEVFFDIFTDDTARMHGLTRIARVGSGEPQFESLWDLDMEFVRTGGGGNPQLEFFHLVEGELRSADSVGSGKITLTEAPANGSAPFRIGMQVIPASRCVPDLGGDVDIDFDVSSNSKSKKSKKAKKAKKAKKVKKVKKAKKKKKDPEPCLAMEGWVFWEHGGGEGGGELVAQLTEEEFTVPEPALGILLLFGLGFIGLRRSWQH